MSSVKEEADKSEHSDDGNMLGELDNTEVGFDNKSQESEDDREFAMGKDGVHYERSNHIFNLAKQRDL